MRAERAQYSILTHDAGVIALVGSAPVRVYSGILPQGIAWPALSMHAISATRLPPIRAGGD